jgi:hypothetical protein
MACKDCLQILPAGERGRGYSACRLLYHFRILPGADRRVFAGLAPRLRFQPKVMVVALFFAVAEYPKDLRCSWMSYDRLLKDDSCSQNKRVALTMVIFDKSHLSGNITCAV